MLPKRLTGVRPRLSLPGATLCVGGAAVTSEEFIDAIKGRRVWRRGGERAPHKALLLLLALGGHAEGKPRLRPYAEVEGALRSLLVRFGPPRARQTPEEPFKRLEPELWEVLDVDPATRKTLGVSDLRSVSGGLSEPVESLLRSDEGLLARAADLLVRSEFGESCHTEILEAVGLRDVVAGRDFGEARHPRPNPDFRRRILAAYSSRCAVCGYGTRLHGEVVGLNAAHIRWPARGGPHETPNGLALCAIHHKAMDRGGISVTDDLRLLVSPHLEGGRMMEPLFRAFEGETIHVPPDAGDRPDPEHLDWHRGQVYRGPRSTATRMQAAT